VHVEHLESGRPVGGMSYIIQRGMEGEESEHTH
jgi:hypothetical protein